jgi:hypothetical protein
MFVFYGEGLLAPRPTLKLEDHPLSIVRGCLEGKRPLGRMRLRWIDNMKMALLEIGWHGIDCIGLAKNRYGWRALVNSAMNLQVP